MHVVTVKRYALSGYAVTGAQFSELAARVHYRATLRDATHFNMTIENGKGSTGNPLVAFSSVATPDPG